MRFCTDGRPCSLVMQSPVPDHFRLVGERGPSEPPSSLSAQNISSWAERSEVLGWTVDNLSMTITPTPKKCLKLCAMLAEWPPSRTIATQRQISRLTEVLQHISFVVRPGRFFMQRLMALTGRSRVGGAAQPRQVISSRSGGGAQWEQSFPAPAKACSQKGVVCGAVVVLDAKLA